MLIDLNLEGRDVILLGGGEESEFKARKLLDGGAKVTVVGKRFTMGLRNLGRLGSLKLLKAEPLEYEHLIRTYMPYLVISATLEPWLDSKVAGAARSIGALINVVDTPALSDFNMPAIAKMGEVRVAISTGGSSPAMAKLLRRRIERLIRPEDVLQVKLQGHVRKLVNESIKEPLSRRETIYRIIHDRKIVSFLRRNRFEEAKARAEQIIQSNNTSSPPKR